MHIRSLNLTFLFLEEIWQRILDDVDLDQKYWDVYVDLYHLDAPKENQQKRNVKYLKKGGNIVIG